MKKKKDLKIQLDRKGLNNLLQTEDLPIWNVATLTFHVRYLEIRVDQKAFRDCRL